MGFNIFRAFCKKKKFEVKVDDERLSPNMNLSPNMKKIITEYVNDLKEIIKDLNGNPDEYNKKVPRIEAIYDFCRYLYLNGYDFQKLE